MVALDGAPWVSWRDRTFVRGNQLPDPETEFNVTTGDWIVGDGDYFTAARSNVGVAGDEPILELCRLNNPAAFALSVDMMFTAPGHLGGFLLGSGTHPGEQGSVVIGHVNQWDSDSVVRARHSGKAASSNDFEQAIADLILNVWYRFEVVCIGNVMWLHLDGELIGINTGTRSPDTSPLAGQWQVDEEWGLYNFGGTFEWGPYYEGGQLEYANLSPVGLFVPQNYTILGVYNGARFKNFRCAEADWGFPS